MRQFFSDFDSLNRYSLSLRFSQNPVQCVHCLKNHHMVSHGVVYKQRSIEHQEPVGKRLLCSNRRGRNGCGRTVQLTLSARIPALHYGTVQLYAFLCAMLIGFSIPKAYLRATEQTQPRQAWRWLSKLTVYLPEYRRRLTSRTQASSNTFKTQSRRLMLLLPTFQHLFVALSSSDACADFQLKFQQRFF